jgi:hypothetical protein
LEKDKPRNQLQGWEIKRRKSKASEIINRRSLIANNKETMDCKSKIKRINIKDISNDNHGKQRNQMNEK